MNTRRLTVSVLVPAQTRALASPVSHPCLAPSTPLAKTCRVLRMGGGCQPGSGWCSLRELRGLRLHFFMRALEHASLIHVLRPRAFPLETQRPLQGREGGTAWHPRWTWQIEWMATRMVRRPCRISPLRRTPRAHVPWDHARHMVPTTGPVMVVHTGRARCRACWHIMLVSWGPTALARTPGCLASTTAQRLTGPRPSEIRAPCSSGPIRQRRSQEFS